MKNGQGRRKAPEMFEDGEGGKRGEGQKGTIAKAPN